MNHLQQWHGVATRCEETLTVHLAGAVFPQLVPPPRLATRLHPCPGAPTVHDSSGGEPLLWPADEALQHCDEPHDRRPAPVVPDGGSMTWISKEEPNTPRARAAWARKTAMSH
ncbi:hypothetical protein [Streptomyces sp. V1I6]|uniref:hypothetical protein n=1 Tax=Streptomyces sp. V1I6 TaxID=3042273 RepID=UPI0027D7F234|nr:hypothetical protein [Streptomyces sp. V1I6]